MDKTLDGLDPLKQKIIREEKVITRKGGGASHGLRTGRPICICKLLIKR